MVEILEFLTDLCRAVKVREERWNIRLDCFKLLIHRNLSELTLNGLRDLIFRLMSRSDSSETLNRCSNLNLLTDTEIIIIHEL